MEWLAKTRFFSAAVAILVALAWFSGTNHCLLGLTKQSCKKVSSVSHCPEHPEKSGCAESRPSAMLACCQGLQSPNVDFAKGKISFYPPLLETWALEVDHLVLSQAPKSIVTSTEYGNGPPWPGSFIATLLGRCLRENAPPLLS